MTGCSTTRCGWQCTACSFERWGTWEPAHSLQRAALNALGTIPLGTVKKRVLKASYHSQKLQTRLQKIARWRNLAFAYLQSHGQPPVATDRGDKGKGKKGREGVPVQPQEEITEVHLWSQVVTCVSFCSSSSQPVDPLVHPCGSSLLSCLGCHPICCPAQTTSLPMQWTAGSSLFSLGFSESPVCSSQLSGEV